MDEELRKLAREHGLFKWDAENGTQVMFLDALRAACEIGRKEGRAEGLSRRDGMQKREGKRRTRAMNERERARRNLNPHKPARAAMYLWGYEYANSGGGLMDFWDQLEESRKRICRELVKDIEKARPEK